MKTLTTASALVLSVAFASALTVPASAEPTTGRSVTVKYGDLNLSNKQGAEQAYARIRHAALTVCGEIGGNDLASQKRLHDCVVDSIGRAIAKVNNDNLNQVFSAKTGKPMPVTGAMLAQR